LAIKPFSALTLRQIHIALACNERRDQLCVSVQRDERPDVDRRADAGRAAAVALAKAGADVAGNFNRREAEAQAICREVEAV
jgi:hypothetical protein